MQFSARMIPKSLDKLPELNLNHLRRLTDDTGMLQHSIFTIPNRRGGIHHGRQCTRTHFCSAAGATAKSVSSGKVRSIHGNFGSLLFSIPGACLQSGEGQIQEFPSL